MAEAKQTSRTQENGSYEYAEEATQDVIPAVATAGVVALINPGLLPGVAIGVGAMLLPKLLPSVGRLAGNIVRPVVKTAVTGGYLAFGAVREVAAEATEQVQDIIAEVEEEQKSGNGTHGRSRAKKSA